MVARPSRIAILGLLVVGTTLGADLGPWRAADAPPLTVAAALGLDGPMAGADLDRRRSLAVAWQTTRCMAGRGFVHIAVPEPAPAVPDGDLDPVAWAERWGFGVSTAPTSPTPVERPDPNLVRIAGLRPVARRAALRALLGDGSTRGCAALAGEAVHGLRDRELAPLRSELSELAAAIDQDREVRAAIGRWRACVGTRADRHDHVMSLLDDFRRRAAAVDDRPAALAEVQADERRVAAEVARCDVAYTAARAHARERLEAPFVIRYRARLADIGDRIRRAEAAYPGVPGSGP